jgi:hypothetical protein
MYKLCFSVPTDAIAHKSQIKPQPFPLMKLAPIGLPPQAPMPLGGLSLLACAVHKVVSYLRYWGRVSRTAVINCT